MVPEIATVAAPAVINSFGGEGGILGLVILALFVVIILIGYVGYKFLDAVMKSHESRMDAQEERHQRERQTFNTEWQSVTREITNDMKLALNSISTKQDNTIIALDRIDRSVSNLKKRRVA